jgi:dephospho-CoA kinase
MLRVALTGGIATGKTYVRDRLGAHGAACLDADHLAHGVMAAGTEATHAIAARFGVRVLDSTGAVDRRVLAPIVFADDEARRDLEAIVHPGVWRAIEAALRGLERAGGTEVAVVEVPLLYETDRAAGFDRVIATVCPPALQVARLIERGLTEADARARLAAQMPAADKGRHADFVVETGGSPAETDRQVDAIWRRLR